MSVYKDTSMYNEESIEVIIAKMAEDEHTVFGWANVAVDKNGDLPFEWQGDIIPPEVLEKAAYKYVLEYGVSGEMHKGEANGILIESAMFTKQKMEAMGIPEGVVPEGWWVGFYIADEAVCEKIKTGKYKMFSIQGKARKLKDI